MTQLYLQVREYLKLCLHCKFQSLCACNVLSAFCWYFCLCSCSWFQATGMRSLSCHWVNCKSVSEGRDLADTDMQKGHCMHRAIFCPASVNQKLWLILWYANTVLYTDRAPARLSLCEAWFVIWKYCNFYDVLLNQGRVVVIDSSADHCAWEDSVIWPNNAGVKQKSPDWLETSEFSPCISLDISIDWSMPSKDASSVGPDCRFPVNVDLPLPVKRIHQSLW